MTFTLLQIRTIQIKRELQKLGILYKAILLLFLICAVFCTFSLYKQAETAIYTSLALIISIMSLHFSRPDKAFILKHIENPYLEILSEYIIFTIPFTILCLFTRQWYYYPITIMAFAIIVPIQFSIKQKTAIPTLSKLIPAYNFEWIGGVRKNYIFLTLCVLLALGTSWLKLFPLIPLWLFTCITIAFYQECEPLYILFAHSRTSKHFLATKIKRHCAMLITVLLPILIINSYFNPEMAWINLIFLIVELSLLVFAILLKYSTYSPNDKLSGNNILISFACVGTLIPFLLPIPLIMSIRNYGRAVNNLNSYFYDQHK